ncbi:hypothetical protein LMIY3S_01459 [Labrys miyagiensis]
MKTDDFIKALAQDSAVRWRLGRALAAAFAGGVVIAGILFFCSIGMRPDVGGAMHTGRFLFKFLVTLTLAATATGLLLRMAQPGVSLGVWGKAVAAAPVLLAVAVIVELVVMPPSTWETRWIGTNARYCMMLIPLLAVGPLACILYVMRQGAPENPGLMGAIAGLVASGIGATFYATHCPDDSPLFVATWYPLATGVVVLAGYFAGRKLLRW